MGEKGAVMEEKGAVTEEKRPTLNKKAPFWSEGAERSGNVFTGRKGTISGTYLPRAPSQAEMVSVW